MNAINRISVIDFLRGLSCLGVLLYHIRVELWIGWWRIESYPEEYSAFVKIAAWFSVPAPFLGYAILLFFLISGFCIHYPNTGPLPEVVWKDYFIRRFWRIYPPYLIAICFTACISYFCYFKWQDTTWDWERILRIASLSQNYPPENGQFLSNPSLWTIPLEVEFYILYPLAFCLFDQLRSKTLVLLALCLCGWSIYLNTKGISWPSFTSLFLWPVWLLGAWTARLYREQKLILLKSPILLLATALCLSFSLTSLLENWPSWIQYLFWTLFYFVFFILCLRNSTQLKSLTGKIVFDTISWLGTISFSLYLVHFPLFKLFGYIHRGIWGEKPDNFFVTLIYLIPVIIIAWVFFKFVENPIHQWSKKTINKRS